MYICNDDSTDDDDEKDDDGDGGVVMVKLQTFLKEPHFSNCSSLFLFFGVLQL